MNIVTPVPTAIPFTTSNVNTESARRDNVQREVIPQLTQPENSSAEAGLGSESDRLKQSAKSAQPAQSPTYERPVVQQNPNADTSGLNSNGDTPDNANQESAGKEDAEERQKQQKEAADKQELDRLKARDQEVRAHEQAHAAVGGQYAGAPSYEFETGPDGQQYAVGGEVSIDISKESEPEETLNKMQQVKAAALAPAEPSPQDFRVASEATRIAAEARVEIAQEDVEQQKEAQEESIERVFGGQNDTNASEVIEEKIPELDEIVEPGDVGAPTRSLEQPEQFVDSAFNAFLAQQNAEDGEISAQRDEEINQRALRIANFYQQTSTPRTEGFQQFA